MSRASTLDAELLAAVRQEVAKLQAVDLFHLPPDRTEAGRIRVAVSDAMNGVLAADFDGLFGRALGDAARKATHRAAERLEAAGCLQRLRLGYGGARVTHLQIVEATAVE